MTNIAQGAAECCVCLETHSECCIFHTSRVNGALTDLFLELIVMDFQPDGVNQVEEIVLR